MLSFNGEIVHLHNPMLFLPNSNAGWIMHVNTYYCIGCSQLITIFKLPKLHPLR